MSRRPRGAAPLLLTALLPALLVVAGPATAADQHGRSSSTAVVAAAPRTTVSGHTPTRFVRKVVLQRRTSDGWHRLVGARTTRTGAYRFSTPRASTRTTVRVLAPATRRRGKTHRAWASRPRSVPARPATPAPGPKPPSDTTLAFRVLSAEQTETVDASQASGLCGQVGGRRTTTAATRGAETGKPRWVATTEPDGTTLVDLDAETELTWSSDLRGCTLQPDGSTVPCTAQRTERPTDGLWSTRVFVRIDKGASTATVYFNPAGPSVGYQGAGNSACHVEEIHQHQVEGSARSVTVPLATLRQSAPFTLTSTGSKHWDADFMGRPASLDQSWRHSITLQRVTSDGAPVG